MRRLMHPLAVLLAVLAIGCPPAAAPPVPEEKPVDRVTRWARGPSHRAPRPRSVDVLLLRLPPDGKPAPPSSTPVTAQCIQADSFLPPPPGEPRFFFASGGRVTAQAPAKGRLGVPVALAGADPALRVTHLLAFLAAESPLRLLVKAERDGASGEEPWLLTVAGPAIAAAEKVSDQPAFRSAAAFFEAFRVPRCLPRGRSCLVVEEGADDQCFLGAEPEPGTTPLKPVPLGPIAAREPAWAPEERSLYLLASCTQ